ncbi:hypothetical protein K432DRAFT_439750 [Lepidopterella palustris CBS 459.81]|uniref:Uncharacterized protein n=1 Tax=Lepidopterella palustris CBS 459.81 TaxID=1314670 RepID=A0A8E2JJE6_9PEZI|nr:hypothetical protein K432DRAFT_439750 [Lepidopterella palustris CBS 459.81]
MPGCSILINLQSSTLKKNIVPLCFISIIPMSLWPLLSMLRSTSLLFFPSHLSQLTSFNSSSIHLLQPLEFGVFSPLAKAYKRRIQEHSVYSAENINRQTLQYLNNGLVEKQQKSGRNLVEAACGDARMLSVAEAQKQNELEKKLRQKQAIAERFHVLRGKSTFVPLV